MALHLPVVQNYDCHGCADCCRHGWPVAATEEERGRIEQQGWGQTLGTTRLFEPFPEGGPRHPYRLAQDETGACIFLDESGRCRIHSRHGARAKPFACQLYPFVVVPAKKGVAISLSFDCPSAADNRGRPLVAQRQELKSLARRAAAEGPCDPPAVSRTESLSWDELRQIAEAVDGLLVDQSRPVLHRVVAAARLCELLGQVRFARIRGRRLTELLGVLCPAAVAEAWDLMQEGRPRPTKRATRLMGQLLFSYGWRPRLAAAKWLGRMGQRWVQIRTARRFSRGRGPVPRLHDPWQTVMFEAIDRPVEHADEDAAEPAWRFLRVKLDTLSFCGAAYYDYPLVEGLAALLLAYAAIGWYARIPLVAQGRELIAREDVLWAVRLVSRNYGRAPVFGKGSERLRILELLVDENVGPLVGWHGL